MDEVGSTPLLVFTVCPVSPSVSICLLEPPLAYYLPFSLPPYTLSACLPVSSGSFCLCLLPSFSLCLSLPFSPPFLLAHCHLCPDPGGLSFLPQYQLPSFHLPTQDVPQALDSLFSPDSHEALFCLPVVQLMDGPSLSLASQARGLGFKEMSCTGPVPFPACQWLLGCD